MDLCNLFVFVFELIFVSVRRKSQLGSRGGFAQIIGIPYNFLCSNKILIHGLFRRSLFNSSIMKT